MSAEPRNFEDPRAEWAKARLRTTPLAPDDGPAAWCRHVEQQGPFVSVADWVAFKVLQGDESNWQAATRASDREVLEAQWFEVRTFAERFWKLSAAEKQEQYAHLKAHLEDNSVALQQLERYRQFLDIDADGGEGESEDVAELIRELVSYEVSGPLERKKRVKRLTLMWSHEPIRWRMAATALQNHPRFAQVAPLLLDRLVRFDPEQDGPRQIANRRSFQRRYASTVRRHKLGKLALNLRTLPLVLLVVPLFMMAVSGIKKGSNSTAPNYGYRPSNRLPPGLSEALLDRDQAKSLADLTGKRDAFKYVEALKEQWEEIARTRGAEGLNELETRLTAAAESAKGSEILELFQAWRFKYGDEIARSRDEEALQPSPSPLSPKRGEGE